MTPLQLFSQMVTTGALVATYSVVLFSIIVQGGSMDLILKRLLRRPADAAHTADLRP